MRYRELRPSARFREHVECVWIVEGAASGPGPAETVVPDGCAELVLHLGDRFAGGLGGVVTRQPCAVLVGPLSGPFHLAKPPGRFLTLGIRFRPGGLRPFLEAPVHEVAGAATDAQAVYGPETARLAEALSEAHDDTSRLRRVEDFLVGRWRRSAHVSGLVRAIIASRGGVRSGALARAAGISLRQLERRFLTEVGLSPKRLLRIVRFQEVLRRTASDAPEWAAVALDCGYFDQAHLVRDFRELAGASPSRFTGRDGLAGNFIAPERLEAFFGH